MNNKIITHIHTITAWSITAVFYRASEWYKENKSSVHIISVGGEWNSGIFTLELQYEVISNG